MNVQQDWTWTLAATAILVGAPPAHALCMQTSLEDQILEAEVIFAGSVRSATLTRAWIGNAARFVFEDLRFAKGSSPADTVVLVQLGGGDVYVSEQISFQVGSRYIVLAAKGFDEHPGTRSTDPCATGHPFHVRLEAARRVVRDADQRSFAVFDSVHAVVLATRPWGPADEPRIMSHGAIVPPQAPPRRAMAEVIRDLDSLGEFSGLPRSSRPKLRYPGEGIRWVQLYPHQDTGDRVTEAEMLRSLAAIAARLTPTPPISR